MTQLKTQKTRHTADKTDAQLIDSLKLYQIELEMQNKNLLEVQAALQLSHDKYADLYSLAPTAYYTCNQEGLIVEVNQAGLNLLGLARNMIINRSFSRFIASEFHLLFSSHRKHAYDRGDPVTLEVKLLRWSEPPLDVQLDCKVIKDPNSDEEQFLICTTNISHRKLQNNLSHLQRIKISSSDRIQSLQEQIYSIADSQGHSLTVINNYIQGCIRRLDLNRYNPDELVTILKKAMEQSTILAGIISRFKNFTTKKFFRYEAADINTIIRDTILLIQYEMTDYPVSIHFQPVESFPVVKLDILCIQQVLLNLARNAYEAMRDAKIREPKLSIELNLVENNIVEISLHDNGPGIQQEIAKTLFEPHFTTKKYAIGLGLAVSRMIVTKHSGELSAYSHPAGGACFQVSLPCVAITG